LTCKDGRNSKKDNKNVAHCSTVNISFKDEDIEDLYLNNLLRKKIEDKIKLISNNTSNKTTCDLSIDIQKKYTDSLIYSDGSVAGKKVRYYVNYVLTEDDKIIKDGNFFMFYNIKISKFQYSNKVLINKDDKNNINRISAKILTGIKKYL
jgi:hypothetical protein